MGKKKKIRKPAVNYINIISNHIPISCCCILQGLCGMDQGKRAGPREKLNCDGGPSQASASPTGN